MADIIVERNAPVASDSGANTALVVLVAVLLIIGAFWLFGGFRGAPAVDNTRTIDVNVGGLPGTGGTGGTAQ